MKMRSAQQCRDRYELLLAALHDSRAQLPSPASRAGGSPAALPQTAPPGASTAGQAQAAPLPLVPPPSSQAPAAAAAADSISAGLSRPVPPAQPALAHHQVVLSAAGASPGPGVHSSPVQTAAAGASPQPLTGQHLAPVSAPQQSTAPVPPSSAQQTQQQQLSTPPNSSTVPSPKGAASGQGTGQASPSVGPADMHVTQPRMGAAWSLSSELQTLREHLAWLVSSNIVCGMAVSSSCSDDDDDITSTPATPGRSDV